MVLGPVGALPCLPPLRMGAHVEGRQALKGPRMGSRSPLFESNLETFSFLLCEEEGKQG